MVRLWVAGVALLLVPAVCLGQSSSVRVTREAVILEQPRGDSSVLVTVPSGIVLEPLELQGTWYRVIVPWPESTRGRTMTTGWINRALVEQLPARTAQQPVASTPSDAVPKTPVLIARQRGDLAVGYAFLHETSLDFPAGVALSDSWRVARNVDLVLESQYERGSRLGVGFNVLGLLSGVRATTSSRDGTGPTAFGQVLTGVMRASATVGLSSTTLTGFAVQPGAGIEVPLGTRTVAVRPQLDVLFGHLAGEWTKDYRLNINVVFRLFRL